MLHVFADKKTNRLQYAADEIAVRLGLSKAEIITEPEDFQSCQGLKVNYSTTEFPGILTIVPHGILSEQVIQPQQVDMENRQDTPVFFITDRSKKIPFDIFAACFYLLSRYEEYLPYAPDQHGRFPVSASILFQHNLLRVPIVEHYVAQFKMALLENYPKVDFTSRQFNAVFTFDIDNAWAYQHKGLLIHTGAIVKNLFGGHFKVIRERLNVLRGKKQDPYDSYEYIQDIITEQELKSVFFFLLGDRDKKDRNLSWKNPALRKLISEILVYSPVGIHPSYHSFKQVKIVQEEISRLQQITGKAITRSRQHYLRFDLPESYQILNELGVQEEYSMGFAGQPGFRAGTCLPFAYYDLSNDEIGKMKIIPLCVMDGTLNEYLHLGIDEAISLSSELIENTQKVQGKFVALWHNETLSDEGIWKGWRKVFEHQVLLCKKAG